ncbi:MAG: type II toxin-antitoxin system VapC family toxin [Cyclobacteriaceae bacterium]
MSGNRLFVDTNILIYLLNGDSEIAELLDRKQLIISFITELELLSISNLDDAEYQIIVDLIGQCQVINVNSEIKDLTVGLRKSRKLKLPDAIIAATAIYSKLPILTADRAFERVEELNVILYEN